MLPPLGTDLTLDTLQHAIHGHEDQGVAGLGHRSDRGVQYVAIPIPNGLTRWTSRPRSGRSGIPPTALAESVIGLFKIEFIGLGGSWRHIDDVEFAVLEWVDWFNHRRLFKSIGTIPATEKETDYSRQDSTTELPRKPFVSKSEGLPVSPARFTACSRGPPEVEAVWFAADSVRRHTRVLWPPHWTGRGLPPVRVDVVPRTPSPRRLSTALRGRTRMAAQSDGENTAAALHRAMESHDEATRAALDSGDPDRIKRLYIDLGDDLQTAVGEHDGPALAWPETADRVAELLADQHGLHLDAGCGPNPVASFRVAEIGDRHVVGADIGLGMVQLAARTAERRGIYFSGVVADLERLPFRDGAFGSIVCDDTIEHVPDDTAGARELLRVTHPDGRVVLATPNRRRLDVLKARVRDQLRGGMRSADAYYAVSSHLREYTWRDLERLVAPFAEVLERGWVPWSRGRAARAASAFTKTRFGRPWGRVVLLVLRPRTTLRSSGRR